VFALFATAIGAVQFSGRGARNDLTKAMADTSGDGRVVVESDGRIIYANEAFRGISGYGVEELAELPSLFELIPEERRIESRERLRERLDGQRKEDRIETVILHRSGRSVDLEIGVKLLQERGEKPRLVIIARDITERKRSEAALRTAEEKYRSIFENAVDGVFQTALDGRLLTVNPAMARMYGYASPEEMVTDISDAGRLYVNPDRRSELANVMRHDGVVPGFEAQVYRKDGVKIWVSTSARALRDNGGELVGFEGTVEDITARKTLEEQLEYLAFHDGLTGLPNRALFLDRLRQALARTDRRDDSVALLFLDLDGFKKINDSLGHEAGDLLLRAVAKRLRTSVRLGDTVARLGGDEFTVLLEDVADEAEATEVAGRIADGLRAPITLSGEEVSVAASIGITLSASAHDRPEDLLREADFAMYEAKNSKDP